MLCHRALLLFCLVIALATTLHPPSTYSANAVLSKLKKCFGKCFGGRAAPSHSPLPAHSQAPSHAPSHVPSHVPLHAHSQPPLPALSLLEQKIVNEGETANADPWVTFDKIKKLGRGSFANTYKVRSRVTGQEYAMKDVRKCRSPFEKRSAEMEFEIGRLLDHKNIARAHSLYKWGGRYCAIVMELVNGVSIGNCYEQFNNEMAWLKEALMANNRHLLWNYVAQLASAVDHMCENKVGHLDLSENNVLIDFATNRVVVIDFGISEIVGKSNQHSGFRTTCTVKSPEAFFTRETAGPPKCSADVFAVCVLTSILMGNPITSAPVQEQCALAPQVFRNYAKIYKGEVDWDEPQNTPLLPSGQIVENMKKFFAQQQITEKEAELMRDMCHWDMDKRLSAAELVVRIEKLKAN